MVQSARKLSESLKHFHKSPSGHHSETTNHDVNDPSKSKVQRRMWVTDIQR